MTLYKIYTAPAGHYKERDKYRFIAAFADGVAGGFYCRTMRESNAYRREDIIMEEVKDVSIDTKPGTIVRAIAVTGEYLEFEEV